MSLFDLLFGKPLFGRTTVSRESEDRIRLDWEKIRQLQKVAGPSNLKQALITADRSLDTALKDIVPGENMGARLKEAKDKFDRDTYNKIWEAHKIRNNLVHESSYEPPYFLINNGIEDLRKGLSALGVNI